MKSVFILLLLPLLFLSACGHPPAQPNPMNMAMPVETVTLKPETVTDESEYIARIDSRQSISIYPRVSAPVARILVVPGQKVSAGQPLIALDAAQQKADLASLQGTAQVYAQNTLQSKETLKASIAEEQSSEANLEFQTKDLKRYQNLLQVQAASQRQVQQGVSAVTQAQKDVEAHQKQVAAQEQAVESTHSQYKKSLSDVASSHANLAYYTIRAPFSGLVGNIPVKLGDLVTPQTQLTSVTQNRQLQVIVSIPADRAGDVHPGSQVRLMDEDGNINGTARVFFVSPDVDAISQTVILRAMLTQDNGKLLPDQTVRAQVVWQEKPGLRIPTSAVTNLAGQDFAFIAVQKGEKFIARQVPVTLGDIVGTDYTVQSGLQQGDVLITSGIQKIRDGAPVQINVH